MTTGGRGIPRLQELSYLEVAATAVSEEVPFEGIRRRMVDHMIKLGMENPGTGNIAAYKPAIDNPKRLDSAVEELASITGQRPAVTRAKKSISNFKLREGMAIGAKVTLRGPRMYEFLDRLVNVAIPRIRDFRGVPTRSFDGRGNYTLGIKEQLIFPEVDYDKVDQVHGLDITFVTTAERDDEALALLSAFGMPFRRQAQRPAVEAQAS